MYVAFLSALTNATWWLTHLCSELVETHRVLQNHGLPRQILLYIKEDKKALAKLLRVCSIFFHIGVGMLWEDALPNDLACIRNVHRRREFTPLIKSLTFWSFEHVVAVEAMMSPVYSRLERLNLFYSSDRAFSSTQLMPYLTPKLKELVISTDLQDRDERQTILDHQSLIHISTTCSGLCTLNLNVNFPVSDLQLTQCLASMPQLKVLTLGDAMDFVMTEAALSIIFTFPQLETLSLACSISHQLASKVSRLEAHTILPRLDTLHISFMEGDSVGPGLLLRTLTTLQTLNITLLNATQLPIVAHPDTFIAISSLTTLPTLEISLGAKVDITDADLAAMRPLENLVDLAVWSRHGSTGDSLNSLHVSSTSIISALNVLETIKCASLDIEWTGVLAADQKADIQQRVPAFCRGWIVPPNVTFHEEAAFGWSRDETRDTTKATADSVWKASIEAFSPDPVPWIDRDLKVFVNDRGLVIPLEEVASDGSFNHLG